MRFIGFVLAGGTATVVNYTLFAVLLLLGVHYLAASAAGYVSGIVVSFAINRRYVFRSSRPAAAQLLRYTLAYGAALLCQLGLLEALVRLGVVPLIANGLALGVVVVLNYGVIARFVFAEPPSTVQPPASMVARG